MAEYIGSPPAPLVAQTMTEIGAALNAQNIPRAMELARTALDRGILHPALLTLRADWLREQGRPQEALKDLYRATELAPNDIAGLNSLGLCLQSMDRHKDAIAAFDRALAVRSDFPPALYNRAFSKEASKDIASARQDYERALTLDPEFAEPLARLAVLAMRRGDHDEARKLAKRALEISPGSQIAAVAMATVDTETGNFSEAERRLTNVLRQGRLNLSDRGMITTMLADVYESQNRTDEAFRAYAAGNDFIRQAYAPRFAIPGSQSACDYAEMLMRGFSQARPWSEGPRPVRTPASGHVFLVGFPRSGTTLLEQVLASHPEIAVISEQEFLLEGFQTFMGDDAALDRLEALALEQAEHLREAYWDAVTRSGIAPEGKIILDKQPLNTVKLPLIAKLFPDAKILFALRDPRDVVLSCFRRRFQMNVDMYEFVTLEGTARFYDIIMRLGALYREKLPLVQRLTWHEALLDNFEGEVRAICEFLGIGWREEMQDFAKRAAERNITTPSGPQIVRGLNSQGTDQWRRYAVHMAPVLPILAPWIKTFGYAES